MKGITDKVLNKYQGFLRTQYTKTHTINDYIRALKTALKTAIKWGHLTGINIDEFKQLKLVKRQPQYMTREEVTRLLQASQQHQVMKVAVPVMVYCAISTAEIMGAIRIDGEHIHYMRKKTGKHVTIPINDELRPYIAHLKDGIHRLIPWKHKRTFSRQFEIVCNAAGIEGVSPHKVRHTFANIALRSGIPLEVVSEYLGHASIDITRQFYVDTDYTKNKEFINRISFDSAAQ